MGAVDREGWNDRVDPGSIRQTSIHHGRRVIDASIPFVVVHCAALPEKLLESELFGHEKGAFTGADQRRLGRFEQAHGGTLLLDEVAEIPLDVQVKLLRVIQERQIQRLGGGAEIPVDVRILAATHRSLETMVEERAFREDLYYRLKVVTIGLPPLRQRLEEIPQLVERCIAEVNAGPSQRQVRGIEPAALDVLYRHSWPGNIRELRNVIQRAAVLGRGERIRVEDIDLGPSKSAPSQRAQPLSEEPRPRPRGAKLRTAGSFTDRQHQILALLERTGRATSLDVVREVGVSRRTALRDLSELIERDIIRREGSRKAAIYRLAES